MPYATKEAKNAATRKRRLLQKVLGVCRECRKPTKGKTLCKGCYSKQRLKVGTKWLDQLNLRHLNRRHEVTPDRKHNGHPSKALHWALVMHRQAH